jgi:oxygen-dependent protoporphyrinogen oxidase
MLQQRPPTRPQREDDVTRVAIIGGGISGLAVGFELLSLGLAKEDLVVLEAEDRPGGNVWTDHVDGFTIEKGPNGFLANMPTTFDLIGRLGMEDRVLPSRDTAAIRFIYRNGQLHRLPEDPTTLLSTKLLSRRGRWRIMAEPFIKKNGHDEETVFDFAKRRIGKEAAAVMVDSMVSGVFAGDSKNLELRAAFPRMAELEARYGSLVKALFALRKKRPATGGSQATGQTKVKMPKSTGFGSRLTSFKDGMEEMIQVLASRLGASLRAGTRVTSLRKTSDGYSLTCEGGEVVQSEAVVLACPAPVAQAFTQEIDSELSSLLGQIRSASISVVATAYKVEDLDSEPWGFGFLVPRGEGIRILGCLWTSAIWEGRAPEGHVLLRTMIGGAHDPEAVGLGDDQLLGIVLEELEKTMGLRAAPILHKIYRWPLGIPQYTPGHTARRLRILEVLKNHQGLFVSGNSYGGVSTNHCIAEAPKVAKGVMDVLGVSIGA